MTASHWASLMRSISPSLVMPALFTRMSIFPNSLWISSTTLWVSSKEAALDAYAFAFTPNASISLTVCSAASFITRSVNAMSAPSDAYFSAIAFPIPRAAPVISATLPDNNPMILNFKHYNLRQSYIFFRENCLFLSAVFLRRAIGGSGNRPIFSEAA